MFCCLSHFLRFQSREPTRSPAIFLSLPLKNEVLCLFEKRHNPLFSLYFFSSSSQYFETDDQEFYKTKVCFILNNDVSEMDLVFAEEKYSKSGQLEKVRRPLQKGAATPSGRPCVQLSLSANDCFLSVWFHVSSGFHARLPAGSYCPDPCSPRRWWSSYRGELRSPLPMKTRCIISTCWPSTGWPAR